MKKCNKKIKNIKVVVALATIIGSSVVSGQAAKSITPNYFANRMHASGSGSLLSSTWKNLKVKVLNGWRNFKGIFTSSSSSTGGNQGKPTLGPNGTINYGFKGDDGEPVGQAKFRRVLMSLNDNNGEDVIYNVRGNSNSGGIVSGPLTIQAEVHSDENGNIGGSVRPIPAPRTQKSFDWSEKNIKN